MIPYIRRVRYDFTDTAFLSHGVFTDVLYERIRFRGDDAMVGDVNLMDAPLLFFRAIGTAGRIANRLIEMANARGIQIVDEYLANGYVPRTKEFLAESLRANDIMHPETTVVNGIWNVNRETEYPFVLKFSKGGRHGNGTFLIRSAEDIDAVRQELRDRHAGGHLFSANNGNWPFLVQEYIPNDGDYRAVCIGYECIGVTKRGAKGDRLIMNKSAHGQRRYRNGKWPRSVGNVASNASRVMGVQFSSVDLVKHSDTGDIYVIEVNEAPQFQHFAGVTGIDVAGLMTRWLMDQAHVPYN